MLELAPIIRLDEQEMQLSGFKGYCSISEETQSSSPAFSTAPKSKAAAEIILKGVTSSFCLIPSTSDLVEMRILQVCQTSGHSVTSRVEFGSVYGTL